MSYNLFKYYFCVATDVEKFSPFIKELQASRINFYDNAAAAKLFTKESNSEPGSSSYLLTMENMNILVVELNQADKTWPEYQNEIGAVEEKSGLAADWLLGQVTVYINHGQSYDEALAQAQALTSLQAVMQVNLKEGHLGRLNWAWPHNQAFYICNLEKENKVNDRFLKQGLPMLEARLIKLQMISNLYRDRQHAVMLEKEELDRKLSNVLHANLVPEQAREQEADELELQVHELSTSYGILAGNYRIILEGITKLEALIASIQRRFKTEPGMVFDAEVFNSFMSSYTKRLGGLKNTAQALQVSHQNHQAAIDVVRSKIDLLMSRENISLQTSIKDLLEVNIAVQKQSLTMQLAASLIEFIVLAYYSLSLWKYLAPDAYHEVPAWGQFAIIISFSGIVVYCTHLIAERMQGDKHVNRKLVVACILLSIILAIIFGISIFMGRPATH